MEATPLSKVPVGKRIARGAGAVHSKELTEVEWMALMKGTISPEDLRRRKLDQAFKQCRQVVYRLDHALLQEKNRRLWTALFDVCVVVAYEALRPRFCPCGALLGRCGHGEEETALTRNEEPSRRSILARLIRWILRRKDAT